MLFALFVCLMIGALYNPCIVYGLDQEKANWKPVVRAPSGILLTF